MLRRIGYGGSGMGGVLVMPLVCIHAGSGENSMYMPSVYSSSCAGFMLNPTDHGCQRQSEIV